MSPTTNTHVCSGVLFAKDLVLVPASCVSKKSTRSEPFPIVRVGRYALNGLDGEDVVEDRHAIEQRVHESFTGNPRDGYDIAILRLDAHNGEDELLNDYESLGDLKDTEELLTLGWFKASSIGAPSHQLQMISSLNPVSDEDCETAFEQLPKGTVCAKPKPHTHCEWDLGAPLIVCTEATGKLRLAGFASFISQTCGNQPYVYVDVGKELRNWIKELGLMESTTELPIPTNASTNVPAYETAPTHEEL